MGRDGLETISAGEVKHWVADGQLEASVVDVWTPQLGPVLLGDDSAHDLWRLTGQLWEPLSILPDRKPSESGASWFFAEPFGNDGGDVYGFSDDNISPGERDVVRLSPAGETGAIETWTGSNSKWDTAFLVTPDGKLVKISENKIWVKRDDKWRAAGEASPPDADERKSMLNGRRYIFLSGDGDVETWLDADLGDLLHLTHSGDGTYRMDAVGHSAPAFVFDAVRDRDDWLLVASAHGLFRFRPRDGRVEVIAAPRDSGEEIKSVCRDEQGRLWAAGDRLYVSSNEGKEWQPVLLPMFDRTYTKRVRRNETSHRGLILALHDRGAVYIDW
jgi:hypothetical protein